MDALNFKPYLDDRFIAEHPDGYYVIVPTDYEPSTPLFCEICDHTMRSRDDEVSHVEFKCCYRCAMKWAHPRRQLWKDGWRPTSQQVSEYELERLPMNVTLDVD